MAERAKDEAQFNFPPYQSELNKAVLGNSPGYLEFMAQDQIKTAIKSVDMYRLYNLKANRHKPEIRRKSDSDEYFLA